MLRTNDVLLLGNGINNLSVNSISWKVLLKKLASDTGHRSIIQYIDKKPFTLIYEEIIFKNASKVIKEIDIKRKVAKLVNEIEPNSFHERLLRSKFKHILTTNYDYALERASTEVVKKSNIKRETKYSLFRRREVASKYVWHIHGESEVPNSILLGHEQYAGQLQKMRHYATANRTTSSTYASQFKLKNKNFDKDGSVYSWLDIFLRDNVHILGLSLDYTEIDIWWLLSYKERLRKISGYDVGDTYFHTKYDSKISDEKQALISILESFGVIIKKYDTYSEMYKTVL